jgi:phospholipase/carboxylesterase
VQQLTNQYPTAGKPLLMGFSGGGMMAYYQALKYGGSYSTIIPISGSLPGGISADEATGMEAQVIAFHGDKDQVIGFGSGKAAAEQLRSHGIEVEFEAFDGGHTTLFTDMKPFITRAIEEKIP